MELRMRVAKNIKELRNQLNLSQEELAYMASVDRGYMGRVENGKHSISLDVLEKLANALEIDPAELLERKRFSMANENKETGILNATPLPLEAQAKARLLCPKTNLVVGLEYLWNTGESSVLWRTEPIDEFIRVPIIRAGLEDR